MKCAFAIAILLALMFRTAACAGTELASADFEAVEDAEAVAVVTLSTPGYNWRDGAWDKPLLLWLDGNSVVTLIPFRGEETAEYPLMLGPVAKGVHTAKLTDSSPGEKPVRVESLSVKLIYKGDDAYIPISHAPFLLGREGNGNSDTALFTWMIIGKSGNGMRIDYSALWSNEDGGTPTAELMARYGRTVDIEWIYGVSFDEQGNIVEEKFQGPRHKVTDFKGRKVGNHPVLRTCTVNNMVCDDGESEFSFPIVPAEAPATGTRERMLDGNPWIYRVMAQELEKEKKITKLVPDPMRARIADPRMYALVDVKTEFFGSELKLRVAIKRDGDEKWHTADMGQGSLLLERPGWARVGVWMPKGTRPEDLRQVRLEAAEGKAGFINVLEAGPVVMLDGAMNPHEKALEWKGNKRLEPGKKPVVVNVAD